MKKYHIGRIHDYSREYSVPSLSYECDTSYGVTRSWIRWPLCPVGGAAFRRMEFFFSQNVRWLNEEKRNDKS